MRDFEACLTRLSELSGLVGASLSPIRHYAGPQPIRAVQNLERWLSATAHPSLQLSEVIETPKACRRLLLLLGASQPSADILIQNPELAHIVLDPEELATPVSFNRLLDGGRTLLRSASSPSHAQDRIRFWKQRWTIPIVVNDLFGTWTPEAVWEALSVLADGLLSLELEDLWARFAAERGLDLSCPLGIIAFGKLGGSELNYSSDIDLAYVFSNAVPDREKALLPKFAESIARLMGERTGRGSVYRVDLRLRPFGGVGPLISPISVFRNYYTNHAEPWEVQALVRTRLACGPAELSRAWEELRRETCFKPALGEFSLEEMVSTRRRIEDLSQEDDLKRGAGGIRDVEFLAQILQLVHGFRLTSLQVRPTCEVLRELNHNNLLEEEDAAELISGYTFLRQLEHRCQLIGDQQTHALPNDPEALLTVAQLMGFSGPNTLRATLATVRQSIQAIYDRIITAGEATGTQNRHRQIVSDALGAESTVWLDGLPLSGDYYSSLVENRDSLSRLTRIVTFAPALLAAFRRSLPLAELILSGEIEETTDESAEFARLPSELSIEAIGRQFASLHARVCAKWVLDAEQNLGLKLTSLTESLIRRLLGRLDLPLDVLALGSFGRSELSLDSDIDVLLLVAQPEQQSNAEKQVQELLSMMDTVHRQGSPLRLDLRLRPDGGKGLLVRTYQGLKAYELDGMELWERFALGQARLISGDPVAKLVVDKSAYGLPITPERLEQLLEMKRRIENERVMPHNVNRDVKLGRGGLSDVEWFIHLHEMRYPSATKAGSEMRIQFRISRLQSAGLLNVLEADTLLEGHRHLLQVRRWLPMLGIDDSIVPENPDKLALLATATGYSDGNAFLSAHSMLSAGIRTLYEDGILRLRG